MFACFFSLGSSPFEPFSSAILPFNTCHCLHSSRFSLMIRDTLSITPIMTLPTLISNQPSPIHPHYRQHQLPRFPIPTIAWSFQFISASIHLTAHCIAAIFISNASIDISLDQLQSEQPAQTAVICPEQPQTTLTNSFASIHKITIAPPAIRSITFGVICQCKISNRPGQGPKPAPQACTFTTTIRNNTPAYRIWAGSVQWLESVGSGRGRVSYKLPRSSPKTPDQTTPLIILPLSPRSSHLSTTIPQPITSLKFCSAPWFRLKAAQRDDVYGSEDRLGGLLQDQP